MSKTYESTNKKLRAIQLRKSADECGNAGFLTFAKINWELAEFLDPWVDEEEMEGNNHE